MKDLKRFSIAFEDEISAVGCFVAGGAILSKLTRSEVSDYDFYPKTKEARLELISELLECSTCVNVTDKSVTFKSHSAMRNETEREIYQVITFDVFPTADSIFETFDFTVCMAAFDFDSRELITHNRFYQDLAARKLYFNEKTRFPYASMLRTKKYSEKGYYLSNPEMMKISMACSEMGIPKTWKEVAEQFGGVYGKAISEMSLTGRVEEDDSLFNDDNNECQTEPPECTFENIVSVLDDLENEAFMLTENSKFNSYDIDDFEEMFSDKKIRYFELVIKKNKNSSSSIYSHSYDKKVYFRILDDNVIEHVERSRVQRWDELYEDSGRLEEVNIKDSGVRLIKTFKWVSKTSEGVYGAVQEKKDGIVYKEGELNSTENDHGIYSGKDLVSIESYRNKSTDAVCVSVLIPIEDIIEVTSRYVRSKTMYIEKEIDPEKHHNMVFVG